MLQAWLLLTLVAGPGGRTLHVGEATCQVPAQWAVTPNGEGFQVASPDGRVLLILTRLALDGERGMKMALEAGPVIPFHVPLRQGAPRFFSQDGHPVGTADYQATPPVGVPAMVRMTVVPLPRGGMFALYAKSAPADFLQAQRAEQSVVDSLRLPGSREPARAEAPPAARGPTGRWVLRQQDGEDHYSYQVDVCGNGRFTYQVRRQSDGDERDGHGRWRAQGAQVQLDPPIGKAGAALLDPDGGVLHLGPGLELKRGPGMPVCP